MYVRWQQYRSQARDQRQRERNDQRARLEATLVKNVRVNGKPRQKHVAFLGSMSIDGSDRPRFWYDVTTRLTRLSNRLSPAEREQIGAAIAKRVGGSLLTEAQVVEFEHRRYTWLNQSSLRGPPLHRRRNGRTRSLLGRTDRTG